MFSGCREEPLQNKAVLPAHSGSITIDGAFALTPLAKVWINEFQKTNPDVKFELNPMGSGKGLMNVLQGKSDLAMVSSEIPKGIDSILWVYPVARLSVVPIINKNNPYFAEIIKRGITRDDLASLFTDSGPVN